MSRSKFAKSAERIEGAILIMSALPSFVFPGETGRDQPWAEKGTKHPGGGSFIGYRKRQGRPGGAKNNPFPRACPPACAGGAPHDIDVPGSPAGRRSVRQGIVPARDQISSLSPLTTLAQRAQRAGCSPSFPTEGRSFQHRSHLPPWAGATSTLISAPVETCT